MIKPQRSEKFNPLIPVYDIVPVSDGAIPVDYAVPPPDISLRDSLVGYRSSSLIFQPEIKDGDVVIVDVSRKPESGNLIVCKGEAGVCVMRFRADRQGRSHFEDSAGNPAPETMPVHGVIVRLQRA